MLMDKNNPILVIHHRGCQDGHGAAWAVECALHDVDVEIIGASYGDGPPNVEGRHVIIVDFSYPLDQLRDLAEKNAVLVLDHHKSAEEELYALPDPPHDGFIPQNAGSLYALFDQERSGAMIAWDYFHGGQAPDMIRLIQDRDLWRFELDSTQQFHAALSTYCPTYGDFRQTVPGNVHNLVDSGSAIQAYREQLVDQITRNAFGCVFSEVGIIPTCNAPLMLASDVCHQIMVEQNSDVAACYVRGLGAEYWSLRSRKPYGPDVSAIAADYGGGGHRHAAGFVISDA